MYRNNQWWFYRILCLGLTGRVFLFGGAKGGLSAEGAKLRLPKARNPSRLGGLGERRKLPSGVWGGDPETEAILNISSQNGVHFGVLVAVGLEHVIVFFTITY